MSYRFGGAEKAEPIAVTPAPAPAPVVEHTAAPVQKPAKADYYVQSIYFDSDQDVPRADQGANLQAALNAANQYKNDQVNCWAMLILMLILNTTLACPNAVYKMLHNTW
ncbi:MAG: hypothetical protein ACLR5T_03920 [Veillonella sp.]